MIIDQGEVESRNTVYVKKDLGFIMQGKWGKKYTEYVCVTISSKLKIKCLFF